jgi:ribosomal protein S18 acetylase RimI-like enzyme
MVDISVEDAQLNLVPVIARIHYESLPNDFLPSLGLDFLERVYYPAAIKSSYANTLVAQVGEGIVGFVTVAYDSDQFSKDVLMNNLFPITRYSLRAIISKPAYLMTDLEILFSALFDKPDPIKGEIVFIAVNEAYRGQGIGKLLVKKSLDFLKQKGVNYCRTKTLSSNLSVVAMYERMGWSVRNKFKFIKKEYVTLVSNKIC